MSPKIKTNLCRNARVFLCSFFPQSTIKTTGKRAMFTIFKPKKPKLIIVEVKTAFSNTYGMLREEYAPPKHKQVDKTKFLKEEIEWMEEGGLVSIDAQLNTTFYFPIPYLIEEEVVA